MDKKKKGPAPQNEQATSAGEQTRKKEPLKTTSKKRQMQAATQIVEDMLTEVHAQVLKKRNVEKVTPIPSAIHELANILLKPKLGIVITGKPKSGKTTIMATLAQFGYLLRWCFLERKHKEEYTKPFTYIRPYDLHPQILEKGKKDLYSILACPVLYIDDLGMEEGVNGSNEIREMLRLVLWYRYDRKLLTIIGTPYDLENLTDLYGLDVGLKLKHGYRFIDINGQYKSD